MKEPLRKFQKRLATIDGVEIASSYIEYLDLAFGDLDDRSKKNYIKLADLKGRINKRKNLYKEIVTEIEKRNKFSQELQKSDKILRTGFVYSY